MNAVYFAGIQLKIIVFCKIFYCKSSYITLLMATNAILLQFFSTEWTVSSLAETTIFSNSSSCNASLSILLIEYGAM